MGYLRIAERSGHIAGSRWIDEETIGQADLEHSTSADDPLAGGRIAFRRPGSCLSQRGRADRPARARGTEPDSNDHLLLERNPACHDSFTRRALPALSGDVMAVTPPPLARILLVERMPASDRSHRGTERELLLERLGSWIRWRYGDIPGRAFLVVTAPRQLPAAVASWAANHGGAVWQLVWFDSEAVLCGLSLTGSDANIEQFAVIQQDSKGATAESVFSRLPDGLWRLLGGNYL